MSARPYLPCREIIEFLADYIEGRLPAETLFEFERHLAVCASCVAYLATYKETIRMAKAAASAPLIEPPEEMVAAILKVMAAEGSDPSPRLGR